MIATRSPVARLGIRAATPLALLTGAYLLFAGHNQPGGGFAAGLVFAAVVALRSITGLQRPTGSTPLLVVGTLLVCAVAIAPVAFGHPLLDQQVYSLKVPALGTVKSGSAFVFDLGVTAIVLGLVLAVLDGLGVTDLANAPAQQRRSDAER